MGLSRSELLLYTGAICRIEPYIHVGDGQSEASIIRPLIGHMWVAPYQARGSLSFSLNKPVQLVDINEVQADITDKLVN